MKTQIQTKTKTAGERFMGNLFYLVIAIFIAWVIDTVLKALFAPFKKFSLDEIEEKVRQDFDRKVARRKERQERFDADESDPMHQFQLRFCTDVESYKNDPENEVYYLWYNEWKKGLILDTWLRWAPDVGDIDGVRANFIAYLNIQVGLHKKASALRKALFLLNIRQCYPELTPTWKGLENDIASYQDEVLEREARDEFGEELAKLGLAEELRDYLSTASVENLDKKALFLKACQEYGYEPQVAIAVLECGVLPGSREAGVVQKIVKEYGLPTLAAKLFMQCELVADDIFEMSDRLDTLKSDLGAENWYKFVPDGSGKTFFQECFETVLKDILGKRRARKVDELCTTTHLNQ